MTAQVIRKSVRVALALVLTANLSGCVSVNVDTRKAADPKAAGGALEVAVYDTPGKAKAGDPTAGNVSMDLGRLEQGREAPVQSSTGASWSLGDLQPGKYRLHLKATEIGSAPSAPPTIRKEDIQINAGEVVRTKMILKKFPVLTVVCVAVGVGAIAGVLAAYANSWNSGWKLNLSSTKRARVTVAPLSRTDRGPEMSRPTRRRAG